MAKGTDLKVTPAGGTINAGDQVTYPDGKVLVVDGRPAMDASFLEALSLKELVGLRGLIDETIRSRRDALADELDEVDRLVGVAAGKPQAKRKPESTLKGIKVAPKYRGPNGETWAGRGAHPKWLAELLAAGHALEEFKL